MAAEPTITAFTASPDEGQGLARDMRVRWALEEVGQAYDVRLVSFEEMKQPAYRALQPFGQIPAYTEGDLTLFESGAICLHLAETRPGLLPADEGARARAITWLFAALNTVEPPVVEREQAEFIEGASWLPELNREIEPRIRKRFGDLSACLDENEWLEGEFTVGDLMMIMVLRRAEGMGILESFPNLCRYVARGMARPAYQRAFAAQRAVFAAVQKETSDA